MTEEVAATHSYLSFKLGDETFATHVSKVREILQLTKITSIPQSPSYMLGVINLRGTVLPVIDARDKFRLPISEATVNTCIIVMNIEMDNESVLLGALVDAVLEVFELNQEEIKPAPTIGSKYKSEFITGMMKMGEGFVILLDIDKVFSADEISFVKENTDEAVAPLS
jgi:purine-binding chemotaxis protein CheW